jgi:2-polyprenyl-3-methyl-5-hydroxy-6-metoxy-1,4-benzoquinol methylase
MGVIERVNPFLLHAPYSEYETWQETKDNSIERGRLAKSILDEYLTCNGLTILDLGSGDGGTSQVFSENNHVAGLDISYLRLKRQTDFNKKIARINGDALFIPFKGKSFDLIIIQDVIEHINDIESFINLTGNILKDNGTIFLTTPNRNSILNIISDPHWGLPFVALLKRETINKYFLKHLPAGNYNTIRLLSLEQLQNYFKGYELRLNTKLALREQLNGKHNTTVGRLSRISLKLINLMRLDKILLKIANNNPGFINKFITPEFYLVIKK